MADENSTGRIRIHPTAEVSPAADLGRGVSVWNQVQVREGARIGAETSIGKNCYIDTGVTIGARCKIQNNVSIFHGVSVADGVFLGPHVCFTNDRLPRAINPDGSLKGAEDWAVSETVVETGASVGANSTILPGLRLGRFCLVAAGSVVTKNVPANGLVMGNPARLAGWVCDCGARLPDGRLADICPECGRPVAVGREGA
jgi:UDP-2-acetamido-3-amino-2,3-dideoxy-glucuronate N-acetyltransferase